MPRIHFPRGCPYHSLSGDGHEWDEGRIDGAGILCSARMRVDFHEIKGMNMGKTKGANGWPDGIEDCRETSLLRVEWEEEFLRPGT